MSNLDAVLTQLQQERTRLSFQLAKLNNAISALNGTTNGRTGRRLSVAGRAKIAAAQRARWARIKGEKVVSIATRKSRTMSASARRKIAAAQRLRWAKWRRGQKAA